MGIWHTVHDFDIFKSNNESAFKGELKQKKKLLNTSVNQKRN